MFYQYLSRGLFAVFFLISGSVFAAIDVHEFDSDVQRARYQAFIDEMRCPKCQNQNLSGSDSPIAMDLRNELYVLIKDGRSDKEIIDFMVERYGDYILYKPRVTAATLLLWFGPVVLFIIAIIALIVIVRHRRSLSEKAPATALSAEERKHLESLLNHNNKTTDTSSEQEPRP